MSEICQWPEARKCICLKCTDTVSGFHPSISGHVIKTLAGQDNDYYLSAAVIQGLAGVYLLKGDTLLPSAVRGAETPACTSRHCFKMSVCRDSERITGSLATEGPNKTTRNKLKTTRKSFYPLLASPNAAPGQGYRQNACKFNRLVRVQALGTVNAPHLSAD